MAELTSPEANRIMSHMNGDHPASLRHYLEYFAKLSSAVVVKPRISSFTGEEMIISYGKVGKRNNFSYKFEPKMAAGEARKRLEAMHREAREGLGLSEFTINSFRLSRSSTIVLVVGALIQALIVFSPSPSLAAFTPFAARHATSLLKYLGFGVSPANVGNTIKLALVAPLQLAHLVEAIWCLMPLLRKYNTTSLIVKVQYFLATIVAGFPIWTDLNKYGESQSNLLKQKSH